MSIFAAIFVFYSLVGAFFWIRLIEGKQNQKKRLKVILSDAGLSLIPGIGFLLFLFWPITLSVYYSYINENEEKSDDDKHDSKKIE